MTDHSSAASTALGTATRPLRVAIIGSGPSGFYAAAALFKAGIDVRVHMFERLPTPFGLVRFGVAPDHAKIRNVIKTYEKTATDLRYQFWGNITIGKDITVEELKQHFDAIIYAFGAKADRKLGVPGEDLKRVYSATDFCGWYNGHPDHQHHQFDLDQSVAAVFGQGNVAMDVVRILAKQAGQLHPTDMVSPAINALAKSKVKTIYCIGRRGPVQAAFTPKEIGELGELEGVDVVIDPKDLELNEVNRQELELPDNTQAQRNFEILQQLAAKPMTGAPRKIVLRFYESPVEIKADTSGGSDGGAVQAVLEKNVLEGEAGQQKARGTGETETLDCGIVLRSVGYKGVSIPGVPFDDRKGVIPNTNGRVSVGEYVVGWIKRGPQGLIGTNKKDSEDSVSQLLADVSKLTPAAHTDDESVAALLGQRGVRVVRYADWLKIDAAEIERGKKLGKPRDNFTSIDDMLAVLNG